MSVLPVAPGSTINRNNPKEQATAIIFVTFAASSGTSHSQNLFLRREFADDLVRRLLTLIYGIRLIFKPSANRPDGSVNRFSITAYLGRPRQSVVTLGSLYLYSDETSIHIICKISIHMIWKTLIYIIYKCIGHRPILEGERQNVSFSLALQ